MQRAAVEELQKTVNELQTALEATDTAYRNVQQQWVEDRKQLDFLIALGRDMYKEGQFYKDSYSWLLYDYQQIMCNMHSQESTTTSTAVNEDPITAGSPCTDAPVVSLEGDPAPDSLCPGESICCSVTDTVASNHDGQQNHPSQYQDHTAAPSPPLIDPPFSLRVHAGVKIPSFIKPPVVLRLAFPSASRAFVGNKDLAKGNSSASRLEKLKKSEPCAEMKKVRDII